MTLQERVQRELKAAMLARDGDRVGTLRLLKSAIDYAKLERKNDDLADADVVAIIQREVKKRRDAAEQFLSGGRPELADKENRDGRTGATGPRDDRRSRRDQQKGNGAGDESRPGQSGRSRRWQDYQRRGGQASPLIKRASAPSREPRTRDRADFRLVRSLTPAGRFYRAKNKSPPR